MMPAYRRRLTAVCAVLLFVVGAACGNGASSPEPPAPGTWLAFPARIFDGPGPITILHASSGFERSIGGVGNYHSITWSPDGRRIAAVRHQGNPELVIFDVRGEVSELTMELDSTDNELYWSPDGLRIAIVSVEKVVMVTPALETLTTVSLPQDSDADGEVGQGLWSPEGTYFAVPFHGLLLVADRAGRGYLHPPASFVNHQGPTERLAVMSWETAEAVAVFEQSDVSGPSRYVLDISGGEAVVAAVSDYAPGAGPVDGLLREASEAAGNREVLPGRIGQPVEARWVVALPSSQDAAPYVLVRVDGVFNVVAPTRFQGASPEALVRELAVLVIPEEATEEL